MQRSLRFLFRQRRPPAVDRMWWYDSPRPLFQRREVPKPGMCNLELVDAKVDGIETINTGIVADRREPGACIDASKMHMGGADCRAGLIQYRAGHRAAARLGVCGERKDQSHRDLERSHGPASDHRSLLRSARPSLVNQPWQVVHPVI